MKLILHVGMEKTGSTALQRALLAMRSELRERSILYPRLPISGLNHNFLRLLTGNRNDLPRQYRHGVEQDPDFFRNKVEPSWDALRRTIDEHKPQTLILSGEILFNAVQHDVRGELKNRLFSLTRNILTLAYVRRPSAHYLSNIQEVLKHSGTFSHPCAPAIRAPIEAWQQHLSSELLVLGYDRSLLVGGDIVADFLHRALGSYAWDNVEIPRISANTSHSAESMALLQEFRRAVLPGRDDERVESGVKLREAIVTVEQNGMDLTRPALTPALAEAIDHSCTDLLWLKNSHGIVFPGIKYERITGAPPVWDSQYPVNVGEICTVSAQRKSALYAHALNVVLEEYQSLRERNRRRRKRSLLRRLFD